MHRSIWLWDDERSKWSEIKIKTTTTMKCMATTTTQPTIITGWMQISKQNNNAKRKQNEGKSIEEKKSRNHLMFASNNFWLVLWAKWNTNTCTLHTHLNTKRNKINKREIIMKQLCTHSQTYPSTTTKLKWQKSNYVVNLIKLQK